VSDWGALASDAAGRDDPNDIVSQLNEYVSDWGALASDAAGRDDPNDIVSQLNGYEREGGTLTLLIGDNDILKLTLVSFDWSDPGDDMFSCIFTGEAPRFSVPAIGAVGLQSSWFPSLEQDLSDSGDGMFSCMFMGQAPMFSLQEIGVIGLRSS